MKRFWISAFFFLLACASLLGNYPAIQKKVISAKWLAGGWNGLPYRSGGYVDEPREIAVNHTGAGDQVYFLVSLQNGLGAIDRGVHLGLAWALAPEPVGLGDVEDIGDANVILTSNPEFEPEGFHLDAVSGWTRLWRRDDRPFVPVQREQSPTRLCEAIGVGVVIGCVFLGGWLAGWGGGLGALLLLSIGMALSPLLGFHAGVGFTGIIAGLSLWGAVKWRKGERKIPLSWLGVAITGVFFLFISSLTLSHTFFPPGGLGVFGGKAKLMYLLGGLPDGFFTDAAWSTFQPAYPPGFALITLACYSFSGGCGEYLTQLLSCCAAGACLLFLCRGIYLPGVLLWLVSTFFGEQTIEMASLFYAEPIMALFVLVGWERVRAGTDDRLGWLLMGAAGWFKNEGILFLPIIWLAVRLIQGANAASLKNLLFGLIFPVLWHVGCRMVGASLYDFARFWQPDWSKAGQTVIEIGKLTFWKPWSYGFAFPVAVGCAFWGGKRFWGIALAVFMMMAVFAGIFSLSLAGDFEWHLASLARLLWIPSLLLLRECAAIISTVEMPDTPRISLNV